MINMFIGHSAGLLRCKLSEEGMHKALRLFASILFQQIQPFLFSALHIAVTGDLKRRDGRQITLVFADQLTFVQAKVY
jgi:hypothetical protein